MARISGDKSYTKLLVETQSKPNFANITGKYYRDIVSIPLSFSLTGRMWTDSRLYERTKELTTWIGRIQSDNNSSILASYNGGFFSAAYQNSKGFGFSLRCVAKIKNSSAFYGSLL